MFSDTKVILSLFDDDFKETLSKDLPTKLKLPGITSKDVKQYKTPNYVNLMKAAIDFSDGIIIGSENINKEVLNYLRFVDKPVLGVQSKDKYIDAYSDFYDEVLMNETILS